MDNDLCKHDNVRINIPSDFVLSACFDGENLFIANRTSLVISLETEGMGTVVRTPTFPPLQSLLAADGTPPSVVPPAMAISVPVGPGKATIRVRGADPKVQQKYLIAASLVGVYTSITGAGLPNGILEYAADIQSALDKAKRCYDANNIVGDIGCQARFEFAAKAALVSLALKLPGIELLSKAPTLAKVLLDLFLGTSKYAFDLVDDAEQVLTGTRALTIAEKAPGDPPQEALRAPSALQAYGISPSIIRLQWNDNSADETGFEISPGPSVRRAPASSQASTGFDWGGLNPETRLCFRVRAVRGNDASEWFPTTAPSDICATTLADDRTVVDTSSSPTSTSTSTSSSTTTTTRLNRWVTTVDSTKGWNFTPLFVREGQPFLVSTTGGPWSVDKVNVPYVGPAGYSSAVDATIFQGCKFDSSQPYGKLLAIVSGVLVPVGAGGQFRAPATGTIGLRINDIDRCLVDNDGSISVELVAA